MKTVFLSKWPVAFGVLEDHDAVAILAFVFRQQDAGIRLAGRVAVGFGDPEPAAVVEAEGDRLHARPARRRTSETVNPRGTVIAAAALSGGRPAYLYSSAGTGRRAASRRRPRRHLGLSAWKRKSSKLTWPQWPVCLSTRRMKIFLPMTDRRSTATRRRSSSARPLARKKTSPTSARTSSTQVSGYGPPPTRKLAHGCVTVNGTDVSVPVAGPFSSQKCRSRNSP